MPRDRDDLQGAQRTDVDDDLAGPRPGGLGVLELVFLAGMPQVARGTPVIYVNFVDYDEVAHHAGPTRAESVRTLDGLDRVLASLEKIAAEVTS